MHAPERSSYRPDLFYDPNPSIPSKYKKILVALAIIVSIGAILFILGELGFIPALVGWIGGGVGVVSIISMIVITWRSKQAKPVDPLKKATLFHGLENTTIRDCSVRSEVDSTATMPSKTEGLSKTPPSIIDEQEEVDSEIEDQKEPLKKAGKLEERPQSNAPKTPPPVEERVVIEEWEPESAANDRSIAGLSRM